MIYHDTVLSDKLDHLTHRVDKLTEIVLKLSAFQGQLIDSAQRQAELLDRILDLAARRKFQTNGPTLPPVSR